MTIRLLSRRSIQIPKRILSGRWKSQDWMNRPLKCWPVRMMRTRRWSYSSKTRYQNWYRMIRSLELCSALIRMPERDCRRRSASEIFGVWRRVIAVAKAWKERAKGSSTGSLWLAGLHLPTADCVKRRGIGRMKTHWEVVHHRRHHQHQHRVLQQPSWLQI